VVLASVSHSGIAAFGHIISLFSPGARKFSRQQGLRLHLTMSDRFPRHLGDAPGGCGFRLLGASRPEVC
jgi:hypothetical protein